MLSISDLRRTVQVVLLLILNLNLNLNPLILNLNPLGPAQHDRIDGRDKPGQARP